MENKNWTGERLETFVFNENTIEHLHRYAITLSYIKGKDVLDIASGEGYGSNLMSGYASSVVGVDIDKDSVDAANKKYKKNNLQFIPGSASFIPLKDNSVDAVVSFETIEHHALHEEMLLEIKRVLRPDGILIMSSPDKKYYSDERNYSNQFHVKELYFEDFKTLIQKHFSNASFFFQNMFTGSLVVPEASKASFEAYQGSYEAISTNSDFIQMYNIAIASDKPLENISFSVFNASELYEKNKWTAMEHYAKQQGDTIRNSWSYRIGHLLLSPMRIFK